MEAQQEPPYKSKGQFGSSPKLYFFKKVYRRNNSVSQCKSRYLCFSFLVLRYI